MANGEDPEKTAPSDLFCLNTIIVVLTNYLITVKHLKIWTPEKFEVIMLEVEQSGFITQ